MQELLQLQQQQQNDELEKPPSTKKVPKKGEIKNSTMEETMERLCEENSEKEEIIKKFNSFTTADNIIIFKEGVSIWEIIEYIKSNRLKNDDRKIYFRIELDKNTTRILSFGLLKS